MSRTKTAGMPPEFARPRLIARGRKRTSEEPTTPAAALPQAFRLPRGRYRHGIADADRRWTISVNTGPGLDTTHAVRTAFEGALKNEGALIIHATAAETERGVSSTTLYIDARTAGRAAELARAAFYRALAAAGFDVERPGWRLALTIEETAEKSVQGAAR